MATNYDKSKTYRTDTEILLNEIVKNTDDLEVNLGDVDVNLEAIETLLTSIKTAVELLDNAISGSEMQVDIVSGTVTANLSATDNAVLDTIDERLDRRINVWAKEGYFASYIIHNYFQKYKDEGLEPPEEIQKYTDEYISHFHIL